MASPREAYDRILLELAQQGLVLGDVSPGAAMLKTSRSTLVLLMGDQERAQFIENADKLLGSLGESEVLLIGGDAETLKTLKKKRPALTQGRVRLYHLAEDGALTNTDGIGAPLGKLLEQPLSPLSPPELQKLQLYLQKGRAQLQAQAEEAQKFQRVLSARKPVVTYGLLGIICVFFALEYLWGGVDSLLTLSRMGALLRDRVFVGEWWRLLSCSFLHAGFVHFGFNLYVLFVLGMMLERILGSWRFLILYVLSALGGSIASSLLLKEGISVGASGALWGMLVAEAALAFRPGGLLPQIAIPGLKRAAMINLGLNVMFSFRPQVDWAAHLGGGIAGALLLFSGALTLGLPQLEKLSFDETPVDKRPVWVTPVAVFLGAALLISGVVGLVQGQPWTLKSAPQMQQAQAGPLSLQLPKGLKPRTPPKEEQGKLTVVWGDTFSDPIVVDLFSLQTPAPLSPEQIAQEAQTLQAELQRGAPPGATQQGKTKTSEESSPSGPRRFMVLSYRLKNGLILERAAVVQSDRLTRVDVLCRPEFYSNYQGHAEKVLRSVKRPGG